MNVEATSKEAIMKACRQIVATQGLTALHMRAVAEACGIALGTLYHYYADKDELVIATVASVCKNIFHLNVPGETALSFPDYIISLFERAKRGAEKYPNFLIAHSVAIAQARRGETKNTMEHCFHHIKTGMLAVLRADSAVDPAAFSASFTEAEFVDLVLDQLLLLLVKGAGNCTVLTELICRVLYR